MAVPPPAISITVLNAVVEELEAPTTVLKSSKTVWISDGTAVIMATSMSVMVVINMAELNLATNAIKAALTVPTSAGPPVETGSVFAQKPAMTEILWVETAAVQTV